MSFPIPPEFERAVLDRVRSGQYASPDAVLQAALNALEQAEALQAAELEELRREIRRGREQLERGQSMPGDVAFARLREKRRGAKS